MASLGRVIFFAVVLTASAAPAWQSASTPSRAARIAPATRLQDGAASTQASPKTNEGTPTVDGEVPPAAAPNGEPPNEQTAAQRLAADHLRKIQQLHFDRRPSTILRLWGKLTEDESVAARDSPNNVNPEMPASDDPKPAPDPFDERMKQLQSQVTLGDWTGVKASLAELEKAEGRALYSRILQSLQQAPDLRSMDPVQMAQMQLVRGQMQQYFETHTIAFPDLWGLAAAAPEPLDAETLRSLARLLANATSAGHILDEFVRSAATEHAKPEAEQILTRRQVAVLLTEANHTLRAGQFLPSLEEAQADLDHEALNLLARHALALYGEDRKSEHLELAWRVLQAVLSAPDVKSVDKEDALKRAVEIAPKIKRELGQSWLEESFANRPERGMEILAAIGSSVSKALQTRPTDSESRLNGLRLQSTAAESLIESAPQRAAEWSPTLTLMAGNWLTEAEFSYKYDRSSSLVPSMRRDVYGNLYYSDDGSLVGQRPNQPNQGQPIKITDLLEITPGSKWLEYVDGGLRPKFDMMLAQLYLKVGEEDLAFPPIERLAQPYPEQAKKLVDEFLTVWTSNHDPNATRNRTNYYMYMYGFERKAESIPLTRSKQQRNLMELAELVKRLGSLPIGEVSSELLVRAFTTCHSSAEVYELSAIQAVFGPIESLKPATIAELAQQMRANLAGLWRQPDVQQQNQTKRKPKDIQAEVLRGYEVARAVVDDAIAKHPESWQLVLVRAALAHDENNYQRELAADAKFSERQEAAMAEFARAARIYAERANSLKSDEQTARVYELWLYASLGACDPQFIDETRAPDTRQPALIREAIDALGGELTEHHRSLFANGLFTRLSALKPNAKYRYLKGGFEIVGDHKQAQEAKSVFDYYHDLVTEIKLETRLDGSDRVGHDQPFGVFVNLRHTREIERESGGFGRYLQNQNSLRFSYNYGRPTEDYRDKFEEMARHALEEQFEVLSITFQTDDVNSRAVAGEYGWRVTPYAYLLLKARGPATDKLPPLRLDLDFLDTSGYAVLPIESPALVVDATSEADEPRPFSHLEITQILDERQANAGKLVVEVKTTARGLIPGLDQLLDVRNEEFELATTDDQGLSVSRFDPDRADNVVVAERNWMLVYQARADREQRPSRFAFAKSLHDGATVTYQRYVDADLAAVEPVVDLEAHYGRQSKRWIWLTALGGAVGLALIVGLSLRRKQPRARRPSSAFPMPDRIDPFTVLGLLRRIDESRGVSEQQASLRADITAIEHHFFADHNGDEGPNLHAIAQRWTSGDG